MKSDRNVKIKQKQIKNLKFSHKKSLSVNINSQLTQFFNDVDRPSHDKESMMSKNSYEIENCQKNVIDNSKNKIQETIQRGSITAVHEEGIGSLDSKKKKFINPIILKPNLSKDLEEDNLYHKNFESFSQIKASKSQMKQFDSFYQQPSSTYEIPNQLNDNNITLNNQQMVDNVFKNTLESKSSYQDSQPYTNFDTNTSSKKQLKEELLLIQKRLSKQNSFIKKHWYTANHETDPNSPSIYDLLAEGIDDLNIIPDAKIKKFVIDMKTNFKKHWNYMRFLAKEPTQILLLKTRKSLLSTSHNLKIKILKQLS